MSRTTVAHFGTVVPGTAVMSTVIRSPLLTRAPPGYWLEWQNGHVCSEPYWRLPPALPRHRTLEAAKEELDSLLDQSVREHLVSDVPLGVWLSGGIDSSAVVATDTPTLPPKLRMRLMMAEAWAVLSGAMPT